MPGYDPRRRSSRTLSSADPKGIPTLPRKLFNHVINGWYTKSPDGNRLRLLLSAISPRRRYSELQLELCNYEWGLRKRAIASLVFKSFPLSTQQPLSERPTIFHSLSLTWERSPTSDESGNLQSMWLPHPITPTSELPNSDDITPSL